MPGLDLTGRTVLVVDDIQFSRNTIASFLNRMGQPTVHLAANGADAIGKLGELGNVSLVISDFNMPVLHGLRLLKAIRVGLEGTRRDMPVAMVTGFSEKHLVENALALDVNAFLIKPVAKKGLERRLERMLQNTQSDDWLKSPDVYRNVDVDDVLYIDDPIEDPDSDAAVAHAFAADMKSRKEGEKPVNMFEEDEILDAPRELTEEEKRAPPPGAKRYAIREVPDGAVLSRDIFTLDGRCCMRAGDKMTPRANALLGDLLDLGHVVDHVWVSE